MKSPRQLQTIANILGGVPILGVLPGSAADRAGLRYGDIVTRVNGLVTATFNDFLSAHDQSGGLLAVEIFREGQTLELEMTVRSHAISEELDDTMPSTRSRIARRIAADSLQKLS